MMNVAMVLIGAAVLAVSLYQLQIAYLNRWRISAKEATARIIAFSGLTVVGIVLFVLPLTSLPYNWNT